jgi:hypothetical protein
MRREEGRASWRTVSFLWNGAVTVTIEGISSEMNALESKELLVQPYVNVTNLVSRRLTVPVLVRNSAGGRIRVVKVEPERVTVIANVQ